MEVPLTKGIPGTVYRAELETAIPKLPAFISECSNIGAGTARLETLTQTMFNVNRRLEVFARQNLPPDTAAVGKKVEQHKHWLKGEGQAIVEFVLAYCRQGDPHKLLKEFDMFAKSLKTRCTVPASQLRLLSSAKLLSCPTTVQGGFKALLACPESFTRRGAAELFTSSDITALSTNPTQKALVAEADKTMVTAWNWLQSFDQTPAVIQLFGWLQVRLVLFVCEKKGKRRRSVQGYQSIR